MADHAKLQAQRSDGNVFAFRRLKWGDPPARFRVSTILRRRFGAPMASPVLLNDDNVQDGVAVAARTSDDVLQGPPVTDLDRWRRRERIVDVAAWGAAIAFVSTLAAALVWTGWNA